MLRVDDLSVSYGSAKALENVNIDVAQRGVLHGVIGPNGAGKLHAAPDPVPVLGQALVKRKLCEPFWTGHDRRIG